MTVTVNVSFNALLEMISSLPATEKQQVWQLLTEELEMDYLDAEDEDAIQQAYAECERGDCLTFAEYDKTRADN